MKHPAIFLDRDGVIIENRSDYVRSWADVEIFPQAIDALVALCDSPYRIVLVTNQSAVGRGIITRETAEGINDRLLAVIHEAGGRSMRSSCVPMVPTTAATAANRSPDCCCAPPWSWISTSVVR